MFVVLGTLHKMSSAITALRPRRPKLIEHRFSVLIIISHRISDKHFHMIDPLISSVVLTSLKHQIPRPEFHFLYVLFGIGLCQNLPCFLHHLARSAATGA